MTRVGTGTEAGTFQTSSDSEAITTIVAPEPVGLGPGQFPFPSIDI